MRTLLRSAYRQCDDLLARTALRLRGDEPALVTLLVHALDLGEDGSTTGTVDPGVRLGIPRFARCIEHFLEAGYSFVTPTEILAGLEPGRRCVLLTFDDGYFNNVAAVPVLRRFGVPATFCISTRFVEEGTAFWWDVVYRERTRRGGDRAAVHAEQLELKHLTADAIDAELVTRYGEECLRPVGDQDRPMTVDELREFANEPLVSIGNHTHDHAILVNYTSEGVHDQIVTCQRRLEAITGRSPLLIAYPNGDYADDAIEASRECGLRLGISTVPRRNPLPLPDDGDALFRIDRFSVRDGMDTETDFRRFRTGLSLRHMLRRSIGLSLAPGMLPIELASEFPAQLFYL
jgi:peptidoglycan/xylan/chitin deacetylase (PgdA/CDA1 family)